MTLCCILVAHRPKRTGLAAQAHPNVCIRRPRARGVSPDALAFAYYLDAPSRAAKDAYAGWAGRRCRRGTGGRGKFGARGTWGSSAHHVALAVRVLAG